MNRKCSYCGAALEGYEAFCPDCGREIPDTAPTVPDETPVRPTASDPEDWFTVHEDDDVPQLKRISVKRPTIEPRTTPVQRQEHAEPQSASEPPRRDYWEPRTGPVPLRSQPVRSRQNPPQRAARPQPTRTGAARKPAQPVQINLRRVLMLAGLGVLLFVLCFGAARLFSGSNGRDYPFTAVVDRYFAAVRTANANNYIATRPDAYTKYLTEGTGSAYQNESDYRAQTASALHDRLAGYQAQYGDIRSITYELTSVVHYNHRCEALSQVLAGWYDFPENSVSDAYIVNGDYTVSGASGSGNYQIDELLLIKIGNDWYFSPDAGSYWRAE